MNDANTQIQQGRDRTPDILQLVSFTVGNEEFGLDILAVQEINRMTDVTRVPHAPAYVRGVVNLRGKIVPVVDLRQRFGLEMKASDTNTRIIVVELRKRTIGFIVDAVKEVLRIPVSVTEPPPPMVLGTSSEFIKAVGKLDNRLLVLIDLDKILPDAEFESVGKAAA